jgi:hypothetical protein
VRRLSGGSVGVSLFTLAPWTPTSIADTLKQDGFSEGTMGPVQTFYFRSEEGAWTRERLAGLASVDVHDGIPTQAFYFTGGLDAVLARAAAR